jgi:lipoyl synthase
MSDSAAGPQGAKPAGIKLRAADKVARIPVRIEPTVREQMLRKPAWIRAELLGSSEVAGLKRTLRAQGLHTVCEEASCPNLGECFAKGTATFMIMGDVCTRRCPFCDVGHGRPLPLDAGEPQRLADTVRAMGLKYVVITSVDRDDLRDGGAGHFVACIDAVRTSCPSTRIEILTPDFRGRLDLAVQVLRAALPDVFNHNLETVPRLYREVRPGADYLHSLRLLERVKQQHGGVPTKTGVMLGLGETIDEVVAVMRDARAHGVDMLTIGQYLQPSLHHLPVRRYVAPAEFDELRDVGLALGFGHVASGPMVRSSYHADVQAGLAFAPP